MNRKETMNDMKQAQKHPQSTPFSPSFPPDEVLEAMARDAHADNEEREQAEEERRRAEWEDEQHQIAQDEADFYESVRRNG